VQGPGAAQLSAGAAALYSPRSTPFPMPPGVPQYVALRLAAAATTLGLHPTPAPMGHHLADLPRASRLQRLRLRRRLRLPINAKGSPAVTTLRDALLAGATLRPNCYVHHLDLGPSDRIESVDYFDESGSPQTMDVGPKGVVMLAAVGDRGRPPLPQLGPRRAQRQHRPPSDVPLPDDRDRRISRAAALAPRPADHAHDRRLLRPRGDRRLHAGRAARGGTIELGGSQNVIDEGKNVPISGAAHKQLMRQSPTRDHLAAMTMQGEDLPQAANRVDLDPGLRDLHGVPVARVTYKNHDFELTAASFYTPRLTNILTAAGATFTATLGGDSPRGILPPELEGSGPEPHGEPGSGFAPPARRTPAR
jgi:hypothetical protein